MEKPQPRTFREHAVGIGALVLVFATVGTLTLVTLAVVVWAWQTVF
jgi:hypothetical protein